jgi:hypothetical protein
MISITFRGLATGVLAVVMAKKALSAALIQEVDGGTVHGNLGCKEPTASSQPGFTNDRSGREDLLRVISDGKI